MLFEGGRTRPGGSKCADGWLDRSAVLDVARAALADARQVDGRASRLCEQGFVTATVLDERSGVVLLEPLTPAPVGQLFELSRLQRRVARLLCAGARIDEIASDVGRSAHTVKSHRSVILKRLGLENRAELAAALRALGRDGAF